MPSVLFVCAANMCRSPLAAAKFRIGMKSQSDLDFLTNSAGTHAISGQEWCPVSVDAGASEGSARQFAENIKEIDLLSYDLILTSGTAQRSAVLQYQLSLRPRLYTIREAALQIEWLTKPGGVLDVASHLDSSLEFDTSVVPTLPNLKPSRWNWLVTEMNAWRGFPTPVINTAESLDIMDPHESTKEIHTETFAQIDQAITSITLGISKVLDR